MAKVLVLRTSNKDDKAYNDFQWPASGPVSCPDWKPTEECGNGLHGIVWPEGNWSDIKSYDEELWQVVEVEESDLVHIGGKVKFPRGEVIYSGEFAIAFTMVAKAWLATIPTSYDAVVDGNNPLTTDSHSARIGSSGDSARIEATGKGAVIAVAGTVNRFRAGDNGCIAAPWHDGERTRFAVGYIGENIKADTWYSIDDKGNFQEIEE